AGKDAFYVFAHIACLCKHRSVYNGERHLQQSCYSLGQESFTGAGLTYHHDVGLFYFHLILLRHGQALVVVVYGYGEYLFGIVLAYHVLIEKCLDLAWFVSLVLLNFGFGVFFLALVAGSFYQQRVRVFNTLVANIALNARKENIYITLGTATERTPFFKLLSHLQ